MRLSKNRESMNCMDSRFARLIFGLRAVILLPVL